MNVFASKPSSLIAVLLCGTALCQTTLHTKATLVVVPTVVTTVSKDVAFALSADDFLLTDDGIPQKVNLEQDSDHPLSLVVLIRQEEPLAVNSPATHISTRCWQMFSVKLQTRSLS